MFIEVAPTRLHFLSCALLAVTRKHVPSLIPSILFSCPSIYTFGLFMLFLGVSASTILLLSSFLFSLSIYLMYAHLFISLKVLS